MIDKEHAAGQSITSGGMSSVYCKKCGWVNVRSGTAHAEHVCPDFNPPLDYPGIPEDLRRQIREERRELVEALREARKYYLADAADISDLLVMNNWTDIPERMLNEERRDELRREADRIDAHLNTGGWISVEERPPTQSDGDKFGRILAVNPNAPRVIIWHWIDVADPKAEHTHWQPLPALPEKTK